MLVSILTRLTFHTVSTDHGLLTTYSRQLPPALRLPYN